MKIIRVSKCGECPHYESAYDFTEIHTNLCLWDGEYKRVYNPDTMPEWCPLEEAE